MNADSKSSASRRLRRVLGYCGGVAALLAIAGVAWWAVSHDTAPSVPTPAASGVAGFVFGDTNHNGKFDVGEQPLGGAKVRLYSTGPLPLLTADADERGVFEVAKVEYITPGETTVRLRVTPVFDFPSGESLPETTGLSQEYTVALGETAALAAAVYKECPTLEDCVGAAAPDLSPILTAGGGDEFPPPTKTFVDTEEIPGRVLLRFATSTANTGGLLHIVALDTVATEDGESQPVQQFIYGERGVYVHDAGEFIYHEVRQRFHVSDYVEFELLSEDQSQVLAKNSKISFCLTDVEQYEYIERAEGAVFLDLPPAECGLEEQGINSGWADYYGPRLHDQWIDVTGLPAGRYWIRMRVDPSEQFIELSRENNDTIFALDYTPSDQ